VTKVRRLVRARRREVGGLFVEGGHFLVISEVISDQ
jgi:hypothetical protein